MDADFQEIVSVGDCEFVNIMRPCLKFGASSYKVSLVFHNERENPQGFKNELCLKMQFLAAETINCLLKNLFRLVKKSVFTLLK